MALRLTGTPAPETDTATATAEPLALRARARLADGDLAGYRGLAEEAAALPDPGRAVAQVALVEHGLAAVGDRPPADRSGRAATLAAVAELAIAALERDPAEPRLLNYAGVCCYELWILDAARALFRAARRLDPGLPHLDSNLAQVAQRRRGPRPTRPLHAAGPGLARRAGSVARRAQPARGMTISLCMIVRDEERMLGRCLAAAADAVDEIVIVDTGSRDATVEIARRFGARVIERAWTGSFADARNASLDAATGDWLLYLDADEVLAAGDGPRLRELAGHTWREAFHLVETSFTGELGDGTAVNHLALRLLRNRPAYRFEGRIHEQIAHALPGWSTGRLGTSSVRLEHFGYLGDVRAGKEKFARNVALLRRQEAEHGASPFLHYNLGCEYGAAEDFVAAAEQFDAAWTLLVRDAATTTAEFAPAVLAGLVRTLRATWQPGQADARAREGLVLYPDFTDLVWEQASTALARRDHVSARRCYERCLEIGDAPARYGGLVGVGSHRSQAALAAIALEHEGDPARARELLRWCLEHRPDYLAIAAPYVTAGLRCGVAAAQLLSELEAGLDGVTPAARHAIAGALVHGGASAAGAEQYRALLVADTLQGSAGAALAELLLVDGDFEQAAGVAAAVDDDDERGALACRIETAARLTTGDLAGAGRALERATRAGVPAAEHTMLAAWLAVARGEAAPPLGVASVPLLGALLEILLGAGTRATGAVGQLQALLAASELPERERRELLAQARLRHGQLADAAAEWMAVCAQRPDARALLGLARVAVRHGLPEDALTFAGGALELDPGCDAARELVHDARLGGRDGRMTDTTSSSTPAGAITGGEAR